MSCTSLTESQRMQKLLSLEPLGDQKPSHLPRCIEQLDEKSCNNDPVLQEIFLTCLPMSVQLILKSHHDKSAEQLTFFADSLIAVTPEAPLPVPFSTISSVTAYVDTIASLCSELVDLKHQLSQQQKFGNSSAPPKLLLLKHSAGTMPDLARMLLNVQNRALCPEMPSPPTNGDQW